MCGCLNNSTMSKSNTTTKVSSTQKTSTNTILKKTVECSITYEEIRDLDLKVIQILRVHKDELLTEINRQLIYWFRNINQECPDLQEYETLKAYVENEYTKYYPQK